MSDLENFFAKRDRKKSSVAKAVKPSGVNTMIEGETVVARETKRKVEPVKDEEDDEWKSVGEEKKDYTGLKIQPLILPEVDESDSDGSTEDGLKANGPWKIEAPTETGSTKWSPLGVKSMPAVYVNPRERQIQKTIDTPKGPPDMKSTLMFPSLQEAGKCLRSNQSVWNRTTVLTSAAQPKLHPPADVHVYRLEESLNAEELSRCVTEMVEKHVPRQVVDTKEIGDPWKSISKSHGDVIVKNDDTNLSEHWRSKEKRSNGTESRRKHNPDKSEKFDHSTEKSTGGKLSSEPLEEKPKVAKYVPPNMRQKLAM